MKIKTNIHNGDRADTMPAPAGPISPTARRPGVVWLVAVLLAAGSIGATWAGAPLAGMILALLAGSAGWRALPDGSIRP